MNGIFGASMRAAVEGFLDNGNAEHKRLAYVNFVSVLLAFILAMIIVSFIGKYLWNGVIVDLFSFAKPAKSIWQILGLSIFVSLMLP
jgi:hypothetical protein